MNVTRAQKDQGRIKWFTDLLDTRFKIPGTSIRFGLDWLIGLIPGVGDSIALFLSGSLVAAMVRNGASGRALSLMLVNIFLDATLGSIPVIGDIFDLFFKANKRNLKLYEKHFQEGKHQGSARPVVIGFLLVILLVILFAIYLTWLLVSSLFSVVF